MQCRELIVDRRTRATSTGFTDPIQTPRSHDMAVDAARSRSDHRIPGQVARKCTRRPPSGAKFSAHIDPYQPHLPMAGIGTEACQQIRLNPRSEHRASKASMEVICVLAGARLYIAG